MYRGGGVNEAGVGRRCGYGGRYSWGQAMFTNDYSNKSQKNRLAVVGIALYLLRATDARHSFVCQHAQRVWLGENQKYRTFPHLNSVCRSTQKRRHCCLTKGASANSACGTSLSPCTIGPIEMKHLTRG